MSNIQPRGLQFALQWALESASDPATAAADWLARDISPSTFSAVDLLTSPNVTLTQLQQAKNVYKTMRVLGEKRADRRIGGRLYLASIAAALVLHNQRITRQSDATIRRALKDMREDQCVPVALRQLAGEALAILGSGKDPAAEENRQEGSGSRGNGLYTQAVDDQDVDSLPLEIERTYLLDRLPALPQDAEVVRIEQGYLPEDGELTGRLRREVRSDGSAHLTHTIKKGSGLVRSEVERTISVEQFDQHWPATAEHRLVKTRYVIHSDGFDWEIDAFDRLNLVLAEVELPTASTVAHPPQWLKRRIVREVTHEKEYRNYQLALRLANELA